MATRAQIEQIIGPNGLQGLVKWHVPHEINKIPDQVIRTYSPPVISPPDPLTSCGVKLEPVQLASGEWVGKFTQVTGPWDNGAVVFMQKLELEFSPVGPSLVQFNVPVDNDWMMVEYRVHLTVKPGVLRDVLIWERRNSPIHQYVTSYTWC